MGDGAKLDKTRTKFTIFKFFLDESRKSPCLKIFPLQNQWRQGARGDMAAALS
jgi:hypothetical protein